MARKEYLNLLWPANHAVAEKIVGHVHHFIGHLGREHVIAKLREDFWIPQICILVCSVLSQCARCKKVFATPMIQQVAPLPEARLMAYETPFSYTGIDLFGPLYIKNGRGTKKSWCCPFTCPTTRCVHLGVVVTPLNFSKIPNNEFERYVRNGSVEGFSFSWRANVEVSS